MAKSVGLGAGSPVDVAVENGRIWVRLSSAPQLADLVDSITPDNVHGESFETLSDRERW
jgi:antitoxin component of MazEF toxin-antitoxin module